jgi:uncharacterized membrane protein
MCLSARLLQQGAPEMFSQPHLRRLRIIFLNNNDKHGNFPDKSIFFHGEEGIFHYFGVKNIKKRVIGRLRRVKWRILPPEKP